MSQEERLAALEAALQETAGRIQQQQVIITDTLGCAQTIFHDQSEILMSDQGAPSSDGNLNAITEGAPSAESQCEGLSQAFLQNALL